MFDFGDGNYLTIKDGIGKAINFNSVLKSYMTEGSFDKDKKAALLQSSTGNFNAKSYSKLASIDGSQTESASITGNNKSNLILTGYNSTVTGGKGKDTIYGGNGSDVFVYDKGDGKDTIYNFGESDMISLVSNADIKDVKIKKGSAVFKIGSGSITVNSLTSGINFNDTIFSNGVFISDEGAKVLGSFSGTINLEELGVSTADASLAKKKLMLNGNAADNYLRGGKGKDLIQGGAGNDTLWGGKKSDTLTGGDGDDVFIFQVGDGNDVITDYSSGDMLQILNKKGTGFADYKKATFKDDTLTLAINGGGKVILKNISDVMTFNINGKILTR